MSVFQIEIICSYKKFIFKYCFYYLTFDMETEMNKTSLNGN